MLPEGMTFPNLAAPYDQALRECVAYLFEDFDVSAILACGTIIRGVPDKRSDLDVFVLHRSPFRQRIQRFFNGVPCEIFVNPESRVPAYFKEEEASRRPCTAHMFATGLVLFDPEGLAAELIGEARVLLARISPAPNLDMARYSAATAFEDAEDMIERDPDAALLLLGQAVYDLVRYRVTAEPGWIPRAKDFLQTLREIDGQAATYATAASQGTLVERFEAARKLGFHVTSAEGFFEWTGPRLQT